MAVMTWCCLPSSFFCCTASGKSTFPSLAYMQNYFSTEFLSKDFAAHSSPPSLFRLVVLSVVLFGLPYGSDQSCSLTLVDHGRGYLGILVSCLICESAIMWLSMRGSILYTQPREAVQYVLYIRLGKTQRSTGFLYADVLYPGLNADGLIFYILIPRSPAILLVELAYAVVGIAWLVQYYQPCSDITAKNLALGE